VLEFSIPEAENATLKRKTVHFNDLPAIPLQMSELVNGRDKVARQGQSHCIMRDEPSFSIL